MGAQRWIAAGLAGLLLTACAPAPEEAGPGFDRDAFVREKQVVHDRAVSYRAYRDIPYVLNPTREPGDEGETHQLLNVFVPDGLALDDAEAPLFFPNLIGGFQAAKAADTTEREVLRALENGFVVVSAGVRGRGSKGADETNVGKAPAALVDLKAAVRFLRRHDDVMPGNAEHIVASGWSAGGAYSALLAASGNSNDFDAALAELGAADERDDIWAANIYCPITDLDHADAAYEWQFAGMDAYTFQGGGTMTDDRRAISAELAATFPDHVNDLGLTPLGGGSPLRLDAAGRGTFADEVTSRLIASAQTALDSGADLSGFDFLTVTDGRVTALDWEGYRQHLGRMKWAPAFDDVFQPSWENDLFGDATTDARHFTAFSLDAQSRYDTDWTAPLADAETVAMMNPLTYLGKPGVDVAKHWRVRHGTRDADTSLAVPLIVATRAANVGADVDFAYAWEVEHAGNYDLREVYSWMDGLES